MKPPTFREDEIFKIALGIRSADERGAYLRQVCGDNDDLHDRIAALLNIADEQGSFLESPPPGLAPTEFPPPPERIGDCIGSYKIREQIGEGGFGVVYVAEQQRPIRRKVAMKVIKPGMDTKDVIARFEAERQALALMEHPNIARVFDGGTTDSGRPFFVMELVQGVPITTFCDARKLSIRERLQLFVDACRAVQHAHQKGIIHRDLKPSNVMVTLQDDEPIVKIIDFGIAKALSQQLTELTLYTAYGQVVGTPLYMSPEQAQLSGLDVDTRSDVYSLGVLLYKLLVGTTPFDKETLQKSSFDEMRRIICEDEPSRPSARYSTLDADAISTVAQNRQTEPERLSASLRGELDWIVMKALEKDRNRRYESPNALAEDIERFHRGEIVAARSPSILYRAKKKVLRHRVAFGASGIVFLALVLGLGVVLVQRGEAIAARELAESRLAELQQQETRTQQLLYTADIRLASQALQEGNVVGAVSLLNRHRPVGDDEDHRGIEWDFLMQQARSTASSHSISEKSLYFISSSKDRSFLAVSGADAIIRIIDAETMELKTELETGQGEVNGLTFIKNGSQLVSAGDDGTLAVWDAANGQLVKRFRFGKEKAYGVVGNPEGTHLIACGETPEVRVFNSSTGEHLKTLSGHERPVEAIALSGDGRLLACASGDGRMSVWDWQNGQLSYLSPETTRRLSSIAFTADNNLLVDASIGGLLRITRIDGFELLVEYQLPAAVQSLATHPDQQMVAVGTRDGSVQFVDLLPLIPARQPPKRLSSDALESKGVRQVHKGRVYHLTWAGTKNLLSVGQDGKLQLTPLRPLGSTQQQVRHIASDKPRSTPDGRFVAGFSHRGNLSISDRETQTPLRLDSSFEGRHWSLLAFSPDGRHLVATTDDGRLDVFEFPKLKALKMQGIPNHPDIENLHFSANGERLVLVCPFDDQIHVLDFPSLKRRFSKYTSCYDAALSPDGDLLAYNKNRDLILIDVATGETIAHSKAHHSETIHQPLFTPDGKNIVTIGTDRMVKIWNIEKNEVELVGTHSKGAPRGLAISRDGQTAITCSRGGEVTFWNLITRQKLMELDGLADGFNALWLSGDGRTLFLADLKQRVTSIRLTQRETVKGSP